MAIGAYILRRLTYIIPIMLGISIIVFVITDLLPGDVVQVMLGAQTEVTQEQIDRLRQEMGLDRAAAVRYMDWLGDAIRGDLGISLRTGRPVMGQLLERLSVSVQVSALSIFLSLLVGIPLGVVSAARNRTWVDFSARILSLAGLSIPGFWLGTLFLIGASIYVGQLPTLGYVPFGEDPVAYLGSMLPPSIAVGAATAAIVTRMTRSSVLEVLGEDYIRTAHAKGLSRRVVLYQHALRNSLIPVITVIGIEFGRLLGNLVVIEELFLLPGLGRYLLNAIYARDVTAIQGSVLFIAMIYALVNLATDLVYGLFDPRVRYE